MKISDSLKGIIVETICLLYILLFVYAALSKLLDFENFQVQIGQSPLISAHASWIGYAVPIVELIAVVMLTVSRLRKAALRLSLALMTTFTAYIFIVLHYSSFVPCSCGGILEKMSWNVHLIFNIVFILLAIVAMLLHEKLDQQISNRDYSRSLKWIAGIIASGTAIVIFLFIWSEQMMHYENPFIRRYPRHAVMFNSKLDLKFNSYYFAGITNGRIYLGNSTAPLQLLSADTNLKNKKVERIIFTEKNVLFQRPLIRVMDQCLYLIDGSVPAVFNGSLKDLNVPKKFNGLPYFDQAEPLDSSRIVLRSNKGKDLANIIGVFDNEKSKSNYNPKLLQKQIDGVFDTDGRLLYDETSQKIVYVYFYRNQFITAGKNAELISRIHTIDTTSHAKLKVSYLKNSTERKMSAPPYIVNAGAAVHNNLVFIYSKIKGRFQDEKTWDQAFIIDVYDVNKQSYLMSFPIYKIKNEKLKSIMVTKNQLYAIIGSSLVLYDLKTILKKEIKSAE